MKKGNIKLTLSIDEKILLRYKRICGGAGLVISKQVENFMLSQLNKK